MPGLVSDGPILLLGGTGQVGFELQRELAPFARLVVPSRKEVDIEDTESLRRFVRATKPCAIVNAAAYTAVDRAEADPDSAARINTEAPRILAGEARDLGVPILHYSTDYVFDGHSSAPYVETDSPNPLSVYGRSKLAGEQALKVADGAWLVLRCSWVYSRRGSNFLRTMLRIGAENSTVNVVDDQYGAPTWAREIARATSGIFAFAKRSGKSILDVVGDNAGVYHLTAGGQTTWYGFARAIFERMPSIQTTVNAIASSQYKTAATRPANSLLDNSKIEKTFGIRMPDWRDQLDGCMKSDP